MRRYRLQFINAQGERVTVECRSFSALARKLEQYTSDGYRCLVEVVQSET